MTGATRTLSKTQKGESPIKKYATAATIGLFAVVGVSGILIFFHLGSGALMGLHEWLGLAFVAASTAHVARNWKGFLKIVKGKPGQAAVALAGVVTAGFIFAAPSGGNPMKAFVMASANAPLGEIAAVADVPLADLAAKLKDQGFVVPRPNDSPAQIAKTSGRELPEVYAVLMDLKKN